MKAKTAQNALADADVAAWLEAHPDFFVNRDSLLLKMNLPHARSSGKGETVSLVERQVSLLRERNLDTRRQLDELVAAARKNNQIFSRSQKLILALIAAKDSHGFFKALETSFKRDFKADAYSLIVFSEYAQQINHFTSSVPQDTAVKYVGGLMTGKDPYLGVLRDSERDFLFRHASDRVQSAAVLPVRNKRQIALLAIGSDDPTYFDKEMGTLFIGFVADVVARLLPRYVYLDPK